MTGLALLHQRLQHAHVSIAKQRKGIAINQRHFTMMDVSHAFTKKLNQRVGVIKRTIIGNAPNTRPSLMMNIHSYKAATNLHRVFQKPT